MLGSIFCLFSFLYSLWIVIIFVIFFGTWTFSIKLKKSSTIFLLSPSFSKDNFFKVHRFLFTLFGYTLNIKLKIIMKSVTSYAKTSVKITSILLICFIFFIQCYYILKDQYLIKEMEEECTVFFYLIKIALKCSLAFLAGALVTDRKFVNMGII